MVSSARPETPVPGAQERILDAARAEFTAFGLRRSNIDDIARRANVGRSTLYRIFPSKEALWERLAEDETAQLMKTLTRIATGRSAQEAVVECFTGAIESITHNDLLMRMLDSDPEVVFVLSARTPTAVVTSSALVAQTLRRSGVTMDDEDLETVAEILVRLISSLLLTPGGRVDLSDPASVRRFARRHLARLVW